MDPHRKRILCAEDDNDTCSMIKSLLDLIGCEVVTVGNYAEALDRINSDRFDLYLLDNWLPGGSGVQLCEKIRARDPEKPILFYSGAAYPADKQEAMEAGANDYLIKPGEVGSLVETIKRLLAMT
ncbi:MAG: response regulator [Pyrinomonadaceae bacterium]|nr:response regulator [Pyrinomonadaceae bacterium]